jgi:hypothetical protein
MVAASLLYTPVGNARLARYVGYDERDVGAFADGAFPQQRVM